MENYTLVCLSVCYITIIQQASTHWYAITYFVAEIDAVPKKSHYRWTIHVCVCVPKWINKIFQVRTDEQHLVHGNSPRLRLVVGTIGGPESRLCAGLCVLYRVGFRFQRTPLLCKLCKKCNSNYHELTIILLLYN